MKEGLKIFRYLLIIINSALYFTGVYSYFLRTYINTTEFLYTLIICALCIVVSVVLAFPEIIKSLKNKYGEDNKKSIIIGCIIVTILFAIKCAGKYVLKLDVVDLNSTSLISMILLFLLQPIYEEITFRIAGYYIGKKINLAFGIIIISILYATVHLPNIVHSSLEGVAYYFVVYFVYSIYVTIMYSHYKENLFFPLYMHYYFNILLCIETVIGMFLL